MPECVILIGLPGAGKTTLYRARFAATHGHISKDVMPQTRSKQSRQDRELRTALAAGRSVVVDNTNVTPADREAIIRIARELGAAVRGIYLEVSTSEAIARNELREGKSRVPKVAIFTSAKRLVPPTIAEGFDALEVVRTP